MSEVKPVGALAFVLLMVTGGQMAPAQSLPPVVTVIENGSAGSNVQVRVGQELDVRLAANPTTGYTWQYRPDPPPLLRSTSRRFEPSATRSPPLPGAGGVQVFAFEATAAGTAHLHFEYRRGEAGAPARSMDLEGTVLP